MLKRPSSPHVLFSLAILSLAGCLGYRTPMRDPNRNAPASSQMRWDAAADRSPEDGRAEDRLPEDRLPEDGRAEDGRAQDALPQDGRTPDILPLDSSRPQDVLPLDSRTQDVLPLDTLPQDGRAQDGLPDLGSDLPPSDAQTPAVCQVEKRYVLVLGVDNHLYRFEPDTLALTSLATVACVSSLNSMTVSPIGPAYISSQAGDLCSVDMRTFQVTSTPFSPLLVNSKSYGMALLPDDTAAGQTLYIAVKEASTSDPDHLERIDLSTFALTSIGYVSPTVPSAELTAGPNRELYGFSVGPTDSLLLNIDPTTASAIDVTRVPAGFTYGAFALVYWQDAFYLFLGDSNANGSTVYRYAKGDAQVTTVGTISASIIGAGVACAN